MYLLSKAGRPALLTFLRNLTPQALLLSVGLVLYVQWRIHGQPLNAVAALGIFIVLIMAVIANLDEFLESAFSQGQEIAERLEVVKKEESSVAVRISRILKFIAREKPRTFVEVVIAFFVIYTALFVVLQAAVQAATRALG